MSVRRANAVEHTRHHLSELLRSLLPWHHACLFTDRLLERCGIFPIKGKASTNKKQRSILSTIAMTQQRSFAHRSSLPINSYASSSDQTQQRSSSVSQALLQGEFYAIANQDTSQWRDEQSYLPTGSDAVWPAQQRYPQPQRDVLQTNSIDNILSNVQGVLRHRGPNDPPWDPVGSQQQQTPQLFDTEHFRGSAASARTVVPDTRSQPRSFAEDSAYYSQSTHKRSAPTDDLSPVGSSQFLSPTNTAPPLFANREPARSVVSDSQLHKKPRRPPVGPLRCPRQGCDRDDLKNQSDLK